MGYYGRKWVMPLIILMTCCHYCVAQNLWQSHPRDCFEICRRTENWVQQLWGGKFVCGYSTTSEPFMDTACYFECEGLEPAGDQLQCLVDYCKHQPYNHEDFCEAPGLNAYITSDSCDGMVGGGKAKFYRHFCNPLSENVIEEAKTEFAGTEIAPAQDCWQKCGGKEKWLEELHNGQFECGYLNTERPRIAIMEPKCVLDCLGIHVEEHIKKRRFRRNYCLLSYCTRTSLRPREFCVSPGVNASITVNDCEKDIMLHEVKHFGLFCNLQSEEELEKAKAQFGV